MEDMTELTTRVKQWGLELGFQHIGISGTNLGQNREKLYAWVQNHFHGTMHYMAKNHHKRTHPEALVPSTLRIISARINYLPATAARAHDVLQDPDQAYISRYALGRDYHKVIRQKLQTLCHKITRETGQFNYRVFADSAPVMEAVIASKSGIGWIGKHTLTLSRQVGSFFFLGEIYLDLPLIEDSPVSGHCGTCQACMDICPTQAIIAPYVLDARRCISYLTIELKGSIPEAFRPLLGNRIYGCDDCQLICPWNRFAQISSEPDFQVRHHLDQISLAQLFYWSEADFQNRMAGSAIYRIGYEQWLRNIAVALGNASGNEETVSALMYRSNDASALVREHVAWALAQHGKQSL